MTIEQKAQRYNEALKRAKKLYEQGTITESLSYVFPELKESEDGIKKWLVEMVEEVRKANPTNAEHNGRCSEAIAWLEKQGEHKCDCKYVGCHVNNMKRWCHKKQSEILYEKCNTKCSEYLKQGEQKPSEREENLMKCLQKANAEIGRLVEENFYLKEQKPAWSEEDERVMESILKHYTYMREEWVNWLKSLKDRIQPQPKQEWSEEDEKGLGDALWCCNQAASIAKDENDMGNAWYAENWLKSLRSQKQYKWNEVDYK